MLVPVCVIREGENQMYTEGEKLDHILEEKILDIEEINGEQRVELKRKLKITEEEVMKNKEKNK